jgi:hypothetical protein
VLGQGSGAVTITGVPGGSQGNTLGAARYYLSALVWNTTDPTSLLLQSSPTVVDMRQGSVTDAQMNID